MRDGLFCEIAAALRAHMGAVLASIVQAEGSAPRGPGARMAVLEDGRVLGTIGGGEVEHRCVQLAQGALLSGTGTMQGFSLLPEETNGIGMVCGGKVEICFEVFLPQDAHALALSEALADAAGSLQNAWRLLQLSPQGVLAQGIVVEQSLSLCAPPSVPLCELCRPKPVRIQRDGQDWYAEPIATAGAVTIYGGGHVSQALVPLLSQLEFPCIVCEDREALLTRELFPHAQELRKVTFSALGSSGILTQQDAAIIVTRGHLADFEVLEQVLRTPAYYIGMMGSRNKVAAAKKRYLERGGSAEQWARVHAPIGLSIHAQTPQEIAVSIAAELVSCRAEARSQG